MTNEWPNERTVEKRVEKRVEKPSEGRSFSDLPSYTEYQLVRIRPIIDTLCVAGILLISSLIIWDYASTSPQRNLAILFRILSLLPLLAGVIVLRRKLWQKYCVSILMALSLLSFSCLAINFMLLPERTPYLPTVLFFFNMGFVILAPLVSNLQLLVHLVVPLPLIYALLAIFGVHEDYFVQYLLHVLPLLGFLNYAAWHLRRTSHANFELFRRNVELATLDPLTLLLNRRAWEQRSTVAYRKAVREGLSFAILITDVDFFKNVNDTYGHPVGDLTLKKLARAFRTALRDYDIVGRFGGEEFVITVSNIPREQVLFLGERLRRVVENIEITLDNDEVLRVTTSVGIAIMDKEDPGMEAVLIRSDKALYQAKQNGRNRVEIYQPSMPKDVSGD